MKHFVTLLLTTVILAFFSTSSLSQSLFFEENFNYPAGQLTVVSGGNWTNFGGTGYFIQVSNEGLSYPGYQVAGSDSGKITLVTNTASAEDVQRTFPSQTGIVYASMLINVLDTTRLWPNSSPNGDYFTGFLPPTGTGYAGRFCIKRSTNDSTFLLGIRAVSTSATAWAAGEYSIGTTYLIVFSYQFIADTSNDVASLWINPNLSGPIPPADAISIASAGSEPSDFTRLFFRQAYTAPSSTPHVDIDKIRVADSWAFAPIPVELTSFTGIVQNEDDVILNWRTASELNNKGFEIQRKSQSSDFTTIVFIPGHGTSTDSHSYSFVDEKLTHGNFTYRLKQIDFNGQFEYSKTIMVTIDRTPKDFSLNQNYPNPFNPSTTINYSLPVESNVTLKVFNMIGQEIETLVKNNQSAGVYSVNWNAKHNASGIYFYSIQTVSNDGAKQFKTIRKMILQK